VVDGFDSGGSPEGDEHGDDEEKNGEEVHWWKRGKGRRIFYWKG
jgi:hypothetical protein